MFQRTGPLGAVTYAGSKFGQILAGSARVVASLPKAVPDLFAKNRASGPGGQVTSVVGAADMTGQVVAARIGWQARVAVVLLIVASLNIFVGVFNLLPAAPAGRRAPGHRDLRTVPCLAGQAAGASPIPGPVDFRRLVPVSVGVFALLVGFGLLLIMADLVNPVHIIQ